MDVYLFGAGRGHLPEHADRIARWHGAVLINYTGPGCKCGRGCGRAKKCPAHKRHWFAGPNLGAPFDAAMAEAVIAELVAAGIIKRQ